MRNPIGAALGDILKVFCRRKGLRSDQPIINDAFTDRSLVYRRSTAQSRRRRIQ